MDRREAEVAQAAAAARAIGHDALCALVREEFVQGPPLREAGGDGWHAQRWLAEFGYDRHSVLETGVLEIGGVAVGVEISSGHAAGELCRRLGPGGRVDVQVIASAGMSIVDGPVCTQPGGPVFLSDGFGRTELSLNYLGHGNESVVMPDGFRRHYDVGAVFGADAVVTVQQQVSDVVNGIILGTSGYPTGEHNPGASTLPSGSQDTGFSGVHFARVSALGPDWAGKVSGVFDADGYLQAQLIARAFAESLQRVARREGGQAAGEAAAERGRDGRELAGLSPTVDFYGPLQLPGRGGGGWQQAIVLAAVVLLIVGIFGLLALRLGLQARAAVLVLRPSAAARAGCAGTTP